jgi:hypothetical protein
VLHARKRLLLAAPRGAFPFVVPLVSSPFFDGSLSSYFPMSE